MVFGFPFFQKLLPRVGAAAAAATVAAGGACAALSKGRPGRSDPDGLSKLRTADFTLSAHHHGKSMVRVLRVRQVRSGRWRVAVHGPCCSSGGRAPRSAASDAPPARAGEQEGTKHTVQHYDVETRLFSPKYSANFTHAQNDGMVATDTQKNTVYVVAKRSKARAKPAAAPDTLKHIRTH